MGERKKCKASYTVAIIEASCSVEESSCFSLKTRWRLHGPLAGSAVYRLPGLAWPGPGHGHGPGSDLGHGPRKTSVDVKQRAKTNTKQPRAGRANKLSQTLAL